MLLILIIIIALGLSFGSFANCLVWRLYRQEKISGRSYCPRCLKKLWWYDNIPLFSYLRLGGRCRFCHQPISWQYPAVEVIVAGLFVFFWFKHLGFAWVDLETLSLFFNLVLIIDSELNIARWEHVSYFQTKGYDVTNRSDVDISPLESEKELIDSELFLMAMPTSENFYKVKVKYNTPDLYKEENEKKYQVKKFLTDVFITLNNKNYEGSEYEKLFFLLSTDGENIIGLNNQFSINSVFRSLHDLNRPYKTGQIGDVYVDFTGFSIGLESTIKFYSSVFTWDSLYPFMSIKTDIGTFKVNESSINEKGLVTLKCIK